MAVVFAAQSVVIIDAGEVGVQILFGKVIKRPLQSGPNFKIPMVEVVKYPTRLREYTMSSREVEGEKVGDDSITVRSFDGLEVKIDSTIWWKIDKNKIYDIYENIARDTDDLKAKVVRPAIRTAIRDECSAIPLQELYSVERQKLGNYIKERLTKTLAKKHILIEEVLIRNIKLPPKVEESVQIKIQKQQEAEAMEAKKDIARKEAEIKEIEANGLAKAQSIIKKNLTPEYLQHEAIQAYKELAKSKNTTFVILPTSKEGTGMPLILNPNKQSVEPQTGPEKETTEEKK
jgi:regulator of protease activity HflC (stomatin/prohibitin superfamily)